jgi:type I restriction enzyme M protein
VAVEDLLATNCNLDRKNPRKKEDFEHVAPEQLAGDILRKEQRITEILEEVRQALLERP